MNNPKFRKGDWVKEKNGTRGMTVIGYTNGQVICGLKTEDGKEKKENFNEEDLALLR